MRADLKILKLRILRVLNLVKTAMTLINTDPDMFGDT